MSPGTSDDTISHGYGPSQTFSIDMTVLTHSTVPSGSISVHTSMDLVRTDTIETGITPVPHMFKALWTVTGT